MFVQLKYMMDGVTDLLVDFLSGKSVMGIAQNLPASSFPSPLSLTTGAPFLINQ